MWGEPSSARGSMPERRRRPPRQHISNRDSRCGSRCRSLYERDCYRLCLILVAPHLVVGIGPTCCSVRTVDTIRQDGGNAAEPPATCGRCKSDLRVKAIGRLLAYCTTKTPRICSIAAQHYTQLSRTDDNTSGRTVKRSFAGFDFPLPDYRSLTPVGKFRDHMNRYT